MSGDATGDLLNALLGRLGPAASPPAGSRAFVDLLVDARREELEDDPVPQSLRRRIVAIARTPGPGLLARAASWLFDSWKDLAPAARGSAAPRLLRFEDELGGVDIEIETRPESGVSLRVAVDEPEDVDLVRFLAPGGTELASAIPGARGVVEVSVPAQIEHVVVVLEGDGVEWVRTPGIPLAP